MRGIRLTPESELQFGLALYFCAQAGREVPRDEIARLFWPTHGVEAGRHCLRQAIYRLRVLGVAVRNNAKTVILDSHFVEADYVPVIAEGSPAMAYLRLEDVDILPSYAPRFSRAYSRWVEDFRMEVGSRIRRGLVRAISEMRARGRYADVERLCRLCLRLDPLNEEATLALAESVALAGGKVEAVGLLDRYAGEIGGGYRPELRVPASLLRERISDRLIRRSQAAIELPMVGREEDVEKVLGAFQRLRGKRAVSYVVTGSAGVGKTRLAYECCRMAELQGARLLTIGTQPSSRTQALFAVSELVDGLLRMPGAIGCAPAALECLRAMSSPVPIRESSLSMDNDGEARFAMVRWSILDVLDAILSEGPLVIHVDDAHQLDAQSQAILQDAFRTHATRPLLLLFTMRPPEPGDVERFARLFSVSTMHDLLPLTDVSCDLLVERFCAVHEETLDDATRERIIQLSGGNPFFLVELLKHRSELVTDDLPITVQALLEDRLSRLSPAGLTVLRAAAVLGLSSSVERLHRMVERKTSDVLAALTELHAAGMLSSVDGGTQCRHDTIREAVLERTPTAARVLLHRRAARTLGREALQEGGVALLWECVHHWRSAGSARNGVRLALVLGKRLLGLGLARDSLSVLQGLEDKVVDGKQRVRALQGQALAAATLGDWSLVENTVQRWSDAFKSEGRRAPLHSRMELLAHEAFYNSQVTYGSLPASINSCLMSQTVTPRHRLAAATLLMISADNNANEPVARDVYNAIHHLTPASKTQRIAWLTTSAIYHAAFGELDKTATTLDELVHESLTVVQPASRAHFVRRACFGLARYGDSDHARDLLVQCLDTFDRLRLSRQAALCMEELGLLMHLAGDHSSTSEWIRRVERLYTETADPFCRAVQFELQVLLAFDLLNPELAPSFELPADIQAALMRSRRGRQSVLSLQLLRQVIRGRIEDSGKDLGTLRELHEVMKTRGYQDLPVTAIASAMSCFRQEELARSLVTGYLFDSRREVRPVPPVLRRVASSLGISEDHVP